MADTEKSGAEAVMPTADINFLVTCLQNATGGTISVSSPSMMLTPSSPFYIIITITITAITRTPSVPNLSVDLERPLT